MSSSPSIEWVLDKVADLATGSGEDEAAFNVLLTLVGSLDPPPEAVRLEPVARRIRKLRLAAVLDHPGELRLGAVRLLAALEIPSLPTLAPHAGQAEAPAPAPAAAAEPAPAAAAESAPAPAAAAEPPVSAPPPAPAAAEPPVSAPPPAPAAAEPPVSEPPPAPAPEPPSAAPAPAPAPEPAPETEAGPGEVGVTPPQQPRRARGRVVLSFPHPGEEADAGRDNGAP